MEFYSLIESQKQGLEISGPKYEYSFKTNTKKEIVLKVRPKGAYYWSVTLDKFSQPSCKKDVSAIMERVHAWEKCPKHHTGAKNYWCKQDFKECPVCEFQNLVNECSEMTSEECNLCGTVMAKVYMGKNKKCTLGCDHSICNDCMENILDTSSTNAPELDGYKINCPFCRSENIIPYD